MPPASIASKARDPGQAFEEADAWMPTRFAAAKAGSFVEPAETAAFSSSSTVVRGQRGSAAAIAAAVAGPLVLREHDVLAQCREGGRAVDCGRQFLQATSQLRGPRFRGPQRREALAPGTVPFRQQPDAKEQQASRSVIARATASVLTRVSRAWVHLDEPCPLPRASGRSEGR